MDEQNERRRKIPPNPLVVVLPPKERHIGVARNVERDSMFLPQLDASRREALRQKCHDLTLDLCLGLAVLGEMDARADAE